MTQTIYLAMGCYWGAEEIYWQTTGVVSTRVGFMGGQAANPTYREVCTGSTGHAETVEVTYDEAVVSPGEILRIFWEHHDPTQGMRQGNDIGDQYRSAIYWTTPEQAEIARAQAAVYEPALLAEGYPPITTEMRSAAEAGTFWPAEESHQRYLEKNPNGYRCHARTGVALPA